MRTQILVDCYRNFWKFKKLRITEESLIKLPDDQFQIVMSWKNDLKDLPDNYQTVKAQKKDCCDIKSWEKHAQKSLMITRRKDIFQKLMEVIQKKNDTYLTFKLQSQIEKQPK